MKIIVNVSGMMCPMCEKHVCQSIKNSLDIKKVDANFKTGEVIIQANCDIADNDIKAAIENEDYSVTNITR